MAAVKGQSMLSVSEAWANPVMCAQAAGDQLLDTCLKGVLSPSQGYK